MSLFSLSIWVSQGGHSEQLLFFALFYQSTPSCLKVGWGGGGGLCDYCVSPSPFALDFGTLDFGTSDSGLTKVEKFSWTFFLLGIPNGEVSAMTYAG